MFSNTITRFIFVVSLLCLCAAPFNSQTSALVTLKAEDLTDGKSINLSKHPVWAYSSGDDARWASRDFDDSGWVRAKSNWQSEEDYSAIQWNGRAWFRLRVGVDDSLVGQPLALRVWQDGATEIYIDGKLIKRFGEIKADSDIEFNPRGLFVPVVFTASGQHTIAVRYSFMAARDLTQGRGLSLSANATKTLSTRPSLPLRDARFGLECRPHPGGQAILANVHQHHAATKIAERGGHFDFNN